MTNSISCQIGRAKGLAGVAAVGAPDSRSETLSPRIVADLEADLSFIAARAVDALCRIDFESHLRWMTDYRRLKRLIETERRRRPRGESGRAERAEGRPQ